MRSIVFLLLAVFALSACQGNKAVALKPAELSSLMTNEDNLQLVDVRTPAEFQSGFLRNALLIDMYSADFESRIEGLNKDQPIAVYCAVGQRSYTVFELLQEKGFKEVYHLEGGIQAWANEGNPIQTY